MFRSIVLVCLLAAVLVGRGAAMSDRMSREDLIASLDAQAIKAGWAVNPGALPKPTVDCSYRDDKGRLFGVYGLGERKSMILLYFVDGSAYAACGYGLSVDQQESGGSPTPRCSPSTPDWPLQPSHRPRPQHARSSRPDPAIL